MADRRDDALIVPGVIVAHLEEVSGDVLCVRAQVDVVAAGREAFDRGICADVIEVEDTATRDKEAYSWG